MVTTANSTKLWGRSDAGGGQMFIRSSDIVVFYV